MIDQLVDEGAINNRPDPNGLIPTIGFMRNWARDEDGSVTCDMYRKCMRYYEHGPEEPSSKPHSEMDAE